MRYKSSHIAPDASKPLIDLRVGELLRRTAEEQPAWSR